ncbi:MAG: amino acid ABC transporter ATP-binding protein [Clostridia bacterium]|nr:amino acid ABC transporter ATP-binding protein [Clostridia bacterium]
MIETMMIVTHEMSFAKEIANRVFYMDEGGIYEDGTPEQVFDHPQKEKTIRFIRRLKVHEANIASRDFDFIGLMTELEEFGRKNMISQKVIYRAQSIFEELCVQIILPQLPESFTMQVDSAYSAKDERMTMRIKYSGKAFDPTDTDNTLSMALVRNAAQSVMHSTIHEDRLTNQVDVTVKS